MIGRRLVATVLCACALALGPGRVARGAEVDDARKLLAAGKYGDCIATVREAMRNGAGALPWRLVLIEALLATGQVDKASAELGALEFHFPDSLQGLWARHEVWRAAGQPARAQEALVRMRAIATTPGARPTDADELVAAGEAALLSGDEPKTVLRTYFEPAVQKDPDCRRGYLAAGALALAKHDDVMAATWFRRGLKRFAHDADLHAGLAQSFLQGDRKAMTAALDAALHANPAHVPALLLRAEHEIDSENYPAARRLLERAWAVDPGHPRAWAYQAVLAHLANEDGGKAEESARAKALGRWAGNPEVDWLVGRKLSQKYRFTEGAAYQRRALKADAGFLPAKIQLAQDLLRLGNTAEGWALADDVHKQDGYDVVAYNLVTLHDHLKKFTTRKSDDFIVRMDAREVEIYGGEVQALLREARGRLDGKYGRVAHAPVEVEIFPDQGDFAVRTFGMPGGAGYMGVCFGNLITANSPSGNAGATVNWKAVLWHEYTHVVTLGLTRNKMPRWLSEGISVYEELQHDSSWGQQMTPRYRQMILAGELTPISRLSAAFMSPKTGEHMMFAYYESALVVEWLVGQYGFDALKAILRDLGQGVLEMRAIEAHTAPLSRLEKEFEEFAKKRAQEVPATTQLAPIEQEAQRLLQDEQWQKAKGPIEKLVTLYPTDRSATSAYLLLATVDRKLGDLAGERKALERLADLASDGLPAYERLMELAETRGDWPAVALNAGRFVAVNPLAATAYRALGRANEALAVSSHGALDRAAAAYRTLLLLEPADPADVHFRLARLQRQTDPRAAKRHVLESLVQAPRFREAQRLLLELRESKR